MSTSEQQLRAGAESLGIEVSDNEFTALLNYLALLQKWNKAYNLTAIRDESGMVALHLLDSLAVHPAVQEADNIIDVGTGPG
ncbi:MAG: 16S rRNA (guanine(527)-N(7))-methyltransferase RsmG, partial [Thalassolituus sp.]